MSISCRLQKVAINSKLKEKRVPKEVPLASTKVHMRLLVLVAFLVGVLAICDFSQQLQTAIQV